MNRSTDPVHPARRVRFGLNYVPSRRWYYLWNDWRVDEIAADFDAIAKLGVDHLRVQLLWPAFQPNSSYVSPLHLERLRELMDLAAERGLDVLLCMLTGWLSGYAFLPPHVTARGVFRDDATLAAEQEFFMAVLGAVADRTNFLGFDLGNELNVLDAEMRPDEGDAWARRLLSWLRPHMRGRWLVNGVDHNPWFTGNGFSTHHLAADYDATTLHCWPQFTGCLIDAPLDGPRSTHLAAFMIGLARHAQSRMGIVRPVWVQEFGCSGEWGDGAARERYMRATVRTSVEAGATWFTWWCSHDIRPVYRFPSLEYDLGVLDVDNRRKPLGAAFAELIAEWAYSAEPRLQSPLDLSDDFLPHRLVDLPAEDWMRQNLHTTTWREFDRYLATLA